MAAQAILPNVTSHNKPTHGSISLAPNWQIHSQDSKLKGTPVPAPPPPPLGVLSNFTGTFGGHGFNQIFRPNSETSKTLPHPIATSDNILELNLTQETLCFSKSLGDVPNRGLGPQLDIHLNGVPYVQTISDVTNTATGKADGTPSGIHFEPGLWMHIPQTTVDPVLGESLTRMASIPHGTTINAQCLAPTTSFAGPPTIKPVDITPIINGGKTFRFPSQDAGDPNTPRLPQDLSKFIAAGTITQDILNNPNLVLEKAIEGQNITKTIFFEVSTAPTAPELGGGTANIAFLLGGAPSGPNADAANMSAQFWIEEVQHTIEVPPFKPGQPPLKIQAPQPHPGAHVPTFVVDPPHEITTPKTITVTSTQIQYSQKVILNFAGLNWPHVSVATLVPIEELPVPPMAWM